MDILKRKTFNINLFLSIVITFFIGWCAISFFPSSLQRVFDSVKDFGISAAYYVMEYAELLGIAKNNIVPTITSLFPPSIDVPNPPLGEVLPFLPVSFDIFKIKMCMYGNSLISAENFLKYISMILGGIVNFGYFLTIGLPAVAIVFYGLKKIAFEANNNYDLDTVPLRIFKFISSFSYRPVKIIISNFFRYLREHDWILKFWLIVWLLNFNIFAIGFEVVAFLFYFVFSFDVGNIYIQIYRLFLDLGPMFRFVPWVCWVVLGLVVFQSLRRKLGFARLANFENRNCGFINAMPIVSLICGSMGKRKTTAVTDMALSQNVIFRNKAFELILKNDIKFPNFPWINFELELRRAMKFHSVYNLSSCSTWVGKKMYRFERNRTQKRCFGYDFNLYGMEYNDNLQIIDLWNVLDNYARLYFIYVIETSFLVSNYAIRDDDMLSSLGNFPIWNHDFFKRDPRLLEAFSRHSHILDFDVLRLGRKVVEENKKVGSFEFGVVVITEIGKERGNNLENQEVKKKDVEANQKNDLFNTWLKLCRHSATVDNFPFIKVFTDEQRPESWGADARDLCSVVTIAECSEPHNTLPFFAFEDGLHSIIFNKFKKLYYKYRYNRGDNSLFMYIYKMIVSKIDNYFTRLENLFGFSVLDVDVENGTMDGEKKSKNYYLMFKKIYSRRFSTDCYGDYFNQKALHSSCGLIDYLTYSTEKATMHEFDLQNSYFIRLLTSVGSVDCPKTTEKEFK